jgi:hypothetical protein
MGRCRSVLDPRQMCHVVLTRAAIRSYLDRAVATLVRLFKSQDSKEKDKEGHK